jgi:hypothetical protein
MLQAEKGSNVKLTIVVCFLSFLLLFGCGGGSTSGGNNGGSGSSNSSNSSSSTVTSINVTCNPPTIATNQTSTCAANVVGTGNYNKAVNWSATGGSISSTGIFTPVVPTPGQSTVIATSVQTSSVTGQAIITIVPSTPAPTASVQGMWEFTWQDTTQPGNTFVLEINLNQDSNGNVTTPLNELDTTGNTYQSQVLYVGSSASNPAYLFLNSPCYTSPLPPSDWVNGGLECGFNYSQESTGSAFLASDYLGMSNFFNLTGSLINNTNFSFETTPGASWQGVVIKGVGTLSSDQNTITGSLTVESSVLSAGNLLSNFTATKVSSVNNLCSTCSKWVISDLNEYPSAGGIAYWEFSPPASSNPPNPAIGSYECDLFSISQGTLDSNHSTAATLDGCNMMFAPGQAAAMSPTTWGMNQVGRFVSYTPLSNTFNFATNFNLYGSNIPTVSPITGYVCSTGSLCPQLSWALINSAPGATPNGPPDYSSNVYMWLGLRSNVIPGSGFELFNGWGVSGPLFIMQ